MVFVIGFNLKKGIEPPEKHKRFGPSVVRGLGVGWSRSSLLARSELRTRAKPADVSRPEPEGDDGSA
jgi:hypothetical protein